MGHKRPPRTRIGGFGGILALTVAVAVAACRPTVLADPFDGESAAGPRSPRDPVQVIVKFRRPSDAPLETLIRLVASCQNGAGVEYLRPMSGGARVFRLVGVDHPDPVIRCLNNHPDIEYAARNAVKHPGTHEPANR